MFTASRSMIRPFMSLSCVVIALTALQLEALAAPFLGTLVYDEDFVGEVSTPTTPELDWNGFGGLDLSIAGNGSPPAGTINPSGHVTWSLTSVAATSPFPNEISGLEAFSADIPSVTNVGVSGDFDALNASLTGALAAGGVFLRSATGAVSVQVYENAAGNATLLVSEQNAAGAIIASATAPIGVIGGGPFATELFLDRSEGTVTGTSIVGASEVSATVALSVQAGETFTGFGNFALITNGVAGDTMTLEGHGVSLFFSGTFVTEPMVSRGWVAANPAIDNGGAVEGDPIGSFPRVGSGGGGGGTKLAGLLFVELPDLQHAPNIQSALLTVHLTRARQTGTLGQVPDNYDVELYSLGLRSSIFVNKPGDYGDGGGVPAGAQLIEADWWVQGDDSQIGTSKSVDIAAVLQGHYSAGVPADTYLVFALYADTPVSVDFSTWFFDEDPLFPGLVIQSASSITVPALSLPMRVVLFALLALAAWHLRNVDRDVRKPGFTEGS